MGNNDVSDEYRLVCCAHARLFGKSIFFGMSDIEREEAQTKLVEFLWDVKYGNKKPEEVFNG